MAKAESTKSSGVGETVNFVSEVRPDEPAPSCHVCGSPMIPKFKCPSCKATTEAVSVGETEREAWAQHVATRIYKDGCFFGKSASIEKWATWIIEAARSAGDAPREPDDVARWARHKTVYDHKLGRYRCEICEPVVDSGAIPAEEEKQ